MPIMTRMRDSMPLILFGLLIAFLITIVFEWGMDYLGIRGGQQDFVGKVNGKKITYREFSELLKTMSDNAKSQSGQEPDEAMSDPSDVTWYVEDGKRFVVATRGKVCSLTFDDGTVSLVNAGGSSVTLDGAGKRIVIQSETGAVLTMDAGFSFVGAIIAQAVSASSLAVSGASTVGGVNVALVGANVPMDAAWVTWLQGLAAAAAYAATMPTVAVGKVT